MGGHVGRFCIWSRSALAKLDGLYGTWTQPSAAKSNFNLPQPMMTNTDLTKLLQSQEIQAAIRPKKQGSTKSTVKRNPLKNASEMIKLNPFAVVQKRLTLNNEEANAKAKDEAKSDKRKAEGGNQKRMRRLALLELEKKRKEEEEAAAVRRQAIKEEAAKAKAEKAAVPKKKKSPAPAKPAKKAKDAKRSASPVTRIDPKDVVMKETIAEPTTESKQIKESKSKPVPKAKAPSPKAESPKLVTPEPEIAVCPVVAE